MQTACPDPGLGSIDVVGETSSTRRRRLVLIDSLVYLWPLSEFDFELGQMLLLLLLLRIIAAYVATGYLQLATAFCIHK